MTKRGASVNKRHPSMTTRRRALPQSCDSVDVDSMWRRHRPGCHTAIKEWESTRDVNLSSTLIVAATNSIIDGSSAVAVNGWQGVTY